MPLVGAMAFCVKDWCSVQLFYCGCQFGEPNLVLVAELFVSGFYRRTGIIDNTDEIWVRNSSLSEFLKTTLLAGFMFHCLHISAPKFILLACRVKFCKQCIFQGVF